MGAVGTAKPGAVMSSSLTATSAAPAGSFEASAEELFAGEAAEALAIAIISGHTSIVQTLLEWNADPNTTHGNEGWTAYHLACAHDQADCLEAIVRAGCDEPKLDCAGRTGAQLAEARGSQRVLDRLAGVLAELRAQRLQVLKQRKSAAYYLPYHPTPPRPVLLLQAKNERRRIERGKRTLLGHALQRARPDGLFLEFGVASGGSINFIAAHAPSGVMVHGFDSFEARNGIRTTSESQHAHAKAHAHAHA